MAYLPTNQGGHTGWYAQLKKVDDWCVAGTLGTTAQELAMYAANDGSPLLERGLRV